MAKSKVGFEEALKELENIVEALERGDLSLDESMETFKKGMDLSKLCSKKLDEVERKISIILESSTGELTEEKFDISEV